MRNVFSYELWDAMGNLAADNHYAELIMNDKYLGLFVIIERVKFDEYRIPVDDEIDENDLDGGYMIKVESAGEQDYFVSLDGYTKYEYYEPDVNELKSPNASIKIASDVNKVERILLDPANYGEDGYADKLNEDAWETLGESIDFKGFADYWILQDSLARNNEGFTRSQYWFNFGSSDYAPDGYDDNKFYMGPVWDFNHSYAATIPSHIGYAIETFFAIPEFWKKLLKSVNFQDYVGERWLELRGTPGVWEDGVMSIENLMKRIDDTALKLLESDTILRDFARWYQSGGMNYEFDLDKFKRYILKRWAWFDRYVCPTCIGEAYELYGRCGYRIYSPGGLETEIFETTSEGYGCSLNRSVGTNYQPTPVNNVTDGYGVYDMGEYNLIWDLIAVGGGTLWDYETMGEIPSPIRTFIYIYSPYSEKTFGQGETKKVNIKWVTSENFRDIQRLCTAYAEPEENITACDSSISKSLEFRIINKFTGETIHSFVSSFYDEEYEWDISNLTEDEIAGTYIVRGTYFGNEIIRSDEGPYFMEASPKLIVSNDVEFSIEPISPLKGCTDINSVNYDITAEVDDGSCSYEQECRDKYIISTADLATTELIEITSGYNVLTYPYLFRTWSRIYFKC
jgi:hypothetical protein